MAQGVNHPVPTISTHVLDTDRGAPAVGVAVTLPGTAARHDVGPAQAMLLQDVIALAKRRQGFAVVVAVRQAQELDEPLSLPVAHHRGAAVIVAALPDTAGSRRSLRRR